MIFIAALLLVGIAAADCDHGQCFKLATGGIKCQSAGKDLEKELEVAKSLIEWNTAYKKFCDDVGCVNTVVPLLNPKGFDCDCITGSGRISTRTVPQMCEKDQNDNYFGSRLLDAITILAQCNVSSDKCKKNINCAYMEDSKKCVFAPNDKNLNLMCTKEVLDYLRENPTGGAFSGTDQAPTILTTILTFCNKQDDKYCVLSDSKLPLKMTKEELDKMCVNNSNSELACARSRLATVATSLRLTGNTIANFLDNAAQDLCAKNTAGDYCLVGASTIAQSKCYTDCSGSECTEKKKTLKPILDSCCGATIKQGNLLETNLGQMAMHMLYPYSFLNFSDIVKNVEALTQTIKVAKATTSNQTDAVATCASASIPQAGCINTTEIELGDLFATIPFSLNDTMKEVLAFFIKSDLAIQLAVPYNTLSLSQPEEDKSVMFYLNSAQKKTSGMKYTVKIKTGMDLADATKKFTSGNLQFFLTGAFLSVNGNGASVSGVYPLLLTKEEKDTFDTPKTGGENTQSTAANASEASTGGVASESTLFLAIATTVAAIFTL